MKKNSIAQRSLCALLALLIALGSFAFDPEKTAIAAQAATGGYSTWSGYSTYLKGAGTYENPFLISTAKDLAYFSKQVADSAGTITYYENNNTSGTKKTLKANTAYYKMTNDIYYNDPNGDEWKSWSDTVAPSNGGGSAHTWTPPGYSDVTNRGFDGSFDGDGHTIYGLYIVHTDKNGIGFIGSVRIGVIKNLTLANGYVHGKHQVGAFAGQVRWGAELVNCTSNMRVVGDNAVGGIAGGNAKNGSSINSNVDINSEPTISSFTMYNCVNNGAVSGTKWAGGILGYISAGASRVQIEKCVNNGDVTVSKLCVGGILGGVRQAEGYGHNVIDGCINNGNVTSGAVATSNTGGIVGCARAVDIYNCQNYGTVQSGGDTVGGIIGGGNSVDALANGKIVNSLNAGEVIGTFNVGGIAGITRSQDIQSCANVGNVTGTYNVGGIVGQTNGNSDLRDTEVSDCYNAGNVVSTTASATVAGIVGNIVCQGTVADNRYAMVMRCVNTGTVTGGRAISATESALANADGSGLYVLTQFDDTCFGLSGVNTIFDGGTEVSAMVDPFVLSALGSAWDASYPCPTLKNIPYHQQDNNGRVDMLTSSGVTVNAQAALEVAVSVNTSGFYTSICSKTLTYGVLAAKADSFEGELKCDTAGVINAAGSLNNGSYTAVVSGQNADDYDDVYTIRPYVSFVENGQTVYIYGNAISTSYYTANGAGTVPAVNETAAFTCDEKLFMLVGGSDEIQCNIGSATDKDSITFLSSDPSVATVNKGVVKGVKAGKAVITVTYTGAWGAVTRYCTVTVLNDLTSKVDANQFADQDGNMRIHTNKLLRRLSITKNDGTVIDYNGTVFTIDGGDNNDEQLKYLLKLREEYLTEGFASGMLTEDEYYRHLLSDKCSIEIMIMLTHRHSDHLYGIRYHLSADPKISVHKFYTVADPKGTSAAGYASWNSMLTDTIDRLNVNSPNLVATKYGFEKQTIRYFSNYNTLSTTDTSLPIKLTICTPKDWSLNTNLNTDATEWQNCSSAWFVFEFAGRKLLFTGDSYIADTGSTYTGASTSGNTSIDYMLYKHKNVVDSSVDLMDAPHHGRLAYNENLFAVTTPSIVLSLLYYGNESVPMVSKAVTTADVYLGGDQEQVFVIGSDGTIDTSGAVVAYSQNAEGHAIRNQISLEDARGYGETVAEEAVLKAPTGVSLPKSAIEIPLGCKVFLAPTVAGDETTDKNVTWEISNLSVVTTDGAYITAHKIGTATVKVKAGNYTDTCTITVVSPEDHVHTPDKNHVCTNCGQTVDHAYSNGVCTICGQACIHTWSDGVCGICGMTCDHNYIEEVTTQPTCTSEGVKTFTCSTCSHSYTESIAATNHTPVAVPGKNATCTEDGLTEGSICDICKEVLMKQEVIPATNHSPVAVPGKDATCTEDGLTEGSICDVCKEVLMKQEVIPATNHTPVAVPGKDATCTENGLTEGSICDVCKEVLVKQEVIPAPGHSFVDGLCGECGEPDPDYVAPVTVPTLTPVLPSVALEEEVKYNIYFTATDLGDLTVSDMGLAVFKTKDENGTVATADDVIPGAIQSGSHYMVQSNGIAAKDMGDSLYFRIYVKLSDGTYAYSKMITFNAVSYVQSVLGGSYDTGLKQTCVALMNYGASAQTYFGYKTDSLMNSFLTADQQAMISGYDASMVSAIVKADSSKIGEFAAVSGGFTKRVPSVSLEGAFAINYYFKPAKTVDGEMTFYYWDKDTYNSVDVLTKENALGSKVMNPNSANEYWASFDGIAAKELDDTVYVAAVYESDGVTYSTGVLAVSISVLCQTHMGADANLTALTESMVVYGDYAKAYFGS